MKVSKIYNIDSIEAISIDIYISVEGAESRSRYLFDFISKLNDIKYKYILRYPNLGANTIENPSIDENISIKEVDPECKNPITKILDTHIANASTDLTILIDYSSMSRLWYGNFLKYCNLLETNVVLNLIFAYNIAQPIDPPQDKKYKFAPMEEYIHFSIPNKPTALIIGLGYEKRRAYSLKEYFDAEEVYLFRTDKFSAPLYYDLVSKHNEQLLTHLDSDHIFEYSIKNISYTNKLLSDLCNTLSKEYRIVIAPCGPKPFTLICLLTALRFDSVDIWRIHNEGEVINKEGTQDTIYTAITFS